MQYSRSAPSSFLASVDEVINTAGPALHPSAFESASSLLLRAASVSTAPAASPATERSNIKQQMEDNRARKQSAADTGVQVHPRLPGECRPRLS